MMMMTVVVVVTVAAVVMMMNNHVKACKAVNIYLSIGTSCGHQSSKR